MFSRTILLNRFLPQRLITFSLFLFLFLVLTPLIGEQKVSSSPKIQLLLKKKISLHQSTLPLRHLFHPSKDRDHSVLSAFLQKDISPYLPQKTSPQYLLATHINTLMKENIIPFSLRFSFAISGKGILLLPHPNSLIQKTPSHSTNNITSKIAQFVATTPSSAATITPPPTKKTPLSQKKSQKTHNVLYILPKEARFLNSIKRGTPIRIQYSKTTKASISIEAQGTLLHSLKNLQNKKENPLKIRIKINHSGKQITDDVIIGVNLLFL